MPGPFPGMDPFLEDPPRWGGVHSGIIAYACGALNAVLPAGYAAEIGERVWVVRPERTIYPDMVVIEPPVSSRRKPGDEGGITATADPPWVVTVEGYEMREAFLDIATVDDPSTLVATVEVLSPSNKAQGGDGRALYLRKQEEVLASRTHLLEIDLLRTGTHTIAAPQALVREKGDWQYVVCLHRAGQGGRFEVWPVNLRNRLPRVLVPLSGADPDVVLDLQAVFDHMYDAGPYRRRVDYRRGPVIPLDVTDAEWADSLLREKGLRQ